MKRVIVMVVTLPLAVLLSGCSATMVSYQSGNSKSTCPPVVSVHSIGGSVTVTDGIQCKVATK